MEDLSHEPPTEIDPYEILALPSTATAAEIKTAYRKFALIHHPDKVPPESKPTAHLRFQELAFAYAILSDPRRRNRYDTTGNTSETLDLEDDDFNWIEFFRAQWADAVTETSITTFKDKYQGSEEERGDVLKAYRAAAGDLNKVFAAVMLSNPLDDEKRFRGHIDGAIEKGEVDAWTAYTEEPEKRRMARVRKAKREAVEAEERAREMGLGKVVKGKKGGGGVGDLAALIQNRNKGRAANFLDELEAKYAGDGGGGGKKGEGGKKGKKREREEPPEEAFAAMRAGRGKKRKVEVVGVKSEKRGKGVKAKKVDVVEEVEEDEDEGEEDFEDEFGDEDEDVDLNDDSPFSDEDEDGDGDEYKAKTKTPAKGKKEKPKPKATSGKRRSTRRKG